jgi:dipeptidyl aminopeptidase/acylaminoacyl peptidase
MLKKFIFLAALAAAPATAAEPIAELKTAGALFGVRENVQNMDLSPDGSKVVYIAPGPGRTSFAYVVDLNAGQPRAVIQSNGAPERLHWCKFVTNERLICRVSAVINQQGTLAGVRRLFAMDADGRNVKELSQRQTGEDTRLNQFGAAVLDWLPGENGSVLMLRDRIARAPTDTITPMAFSKANGLAVERIDTRTLKSSIIEKPDNNASGYLTDGRGKVRIKFVPEVRGDQYTSRTNILFRRAGSDAWQPLGFYDDEGGSGIYPLAVDATIDAAYVLNKLNGRDALYRIGLDGSNKEEMVYANERVDVDGVVRSSRGDRVIGVTFAEERRHVVYFDPEYAALAGSIAKALPKLPLIDFAGSSLDGQKLLIHAGSDSDPGRYLLFDRTNKTLAEVTPDRPGLAATPLASVRPITYAAADGTRIPGYLTLPPGRLAKGLPAVVLPHGGPSARDEWGFDWLAQYLANQGYAVLQPNFRGSAGFGDAWLRQNGFRDWRTSVGDVVEGGKWLVSEGIADPAKLAIVGWSYGGYAALQSGVVAPNQFKAIVAVAPVTDLQLLKEDARDYTNRRAVERFVGSGPHVTEGSPLRNVSRIAAPVLLFHGTKDLNVNVGHSQKMDKALRDAGKQSELVVYEGLEHDLADSNARAQMLDRIGAFLKQAIGQ